MRKFSAAAAGLLLLALTIPTFAQRERQSDPDSQSRKFFEQLRSLFGRFRDGDLQRAFETAGPIKCSELTSGTGEWRNVAFFNEDRKLGDWYHASLDEVKGDLSTYIFKGSCPTEQSPVQVITKFPVEDSINRYVSGRIRFEQIKMITNPTVSASFDSRTEAYGFELPYLYLKRGKNARDITYSLIAPTSEDRYATDMTNSWDCKSVRANDLTFQFLICDTQVRAPGADPRRQSRSFGSAAYFILSDGKEASTSMKLSFGNESTEDKTDIPAPAPSPAPSPAPVRDDVPVGPLATWQVPNPASKLAEADKGEFRIRFKQETWADKIGAAQVLAEQKVSTFDPAKPPSKTDYCVWRPASATLAARALGREPDKDVAYTLTANETSITFELKTHNGSRVGALQCFFPGADAESVSADRWVGVVGMHLTLEVLP